MCGWLYLVFWFWVYLVSGFCFCFWVSIYFCFLGSVFLGLVQWVGVGGGDCGWGWLVAVVVEKKKMGGDVVVG